MCVSVRRIPLIEFFITLHKKDPDLTSSATNKNYIENTSECPKMSQICQKFSLGWKHKATTLHAICLFKTVVISLSLRTSNFMKTFVKSGDSSETLFISRVTVNMVEKQKHLCNTAASPLSITVRQNMLKLTRKVIRNGKLPPYFFLSNLDLKQGVDKVYVMIDFICMGLLELQGTQSKREIHNKLENGKRGIPSQGGKVDFDL